MSDDIAEIDFEACASVLSPASLSVLNGEILLALPEYRAKNLIRFWLGIHGVDQFRGTIFSAVLAGVRACIDMPSSRHRLKITVDFKKSLFLGFSKGCLYFYREFRGDQVLVPGSDFGRLRDELGVEFVSQKIDRAMPLQSWKDQASELLSFYMSDDDRVLIKSQKAWCWRTAKKGEKLHLPSKPYAMKLTKLWLEWGVPAALRSQWPLLVDHNNNVVLIPGCYAGLSRVF